MEANSSAFPGDGLPLPAPLALPSPGGSGPVHLMCTKGPTCATYACGHSKPENISSLFATKTKRDSAKNDLKKYARIVARIESWIRHRMFLTSSEILRPEHLTRHGHDNQLRTF